ncbi:Copia protein [Nymphaea thermarum]|nr:Copia protein [Nymphaea thermarum]
MVLEHLKHYPGRGLLFKKGATLEMESSPTDFCVFVGGNLITWKNKKQAAVARSSVESEYRAMTQTTTEMTFIKSMITSLGISISLPVKMNCDNKAAIHITNNLVFHERLQAGTAASRLQPPSAFLATSTAAASASTAIGDRHSSALGSRQLPTSESSSLVFITRATSYVEARLSRVSRAESCNTRGLVLTPGHISGYARASPWPTVSGFEFPRLPVLVCSSRLRLLIFSKCRAVHLVHPRAAELEVRRRDTRLVWRFRLFEPGRERSEIAEALRRSAAVGGPTHLPCLRTRLQRQRQRVQLGRVWFSASVEVHLWHLSAQVLQMAKSKKNLNPDDPVVEELPLEPQDMTQRGVSTEISEQTIGRMGNLERELVQLRRDIDRAENHRRKEMDKQLLDHQKEIEDIRKDRRKDMEENVVARSSAESEYRAMAQTIAEMTLVRSMLTNLGIFVTLPMKMYCDNKVATYIANNLYSMRGQNISRLIVTSLKIWCRKELIYCACFIRELGNRLTTMALPIGEFTRGCDKLSMIDIYAPA